MMSENSKRKRVDIEPTKHSKKINTQSPNHNTNPTNNNITNKRKNCELSHNNNKKLKMLYTSQTQGTLDTINNPTPAHTPPHPPITNPPNVNNKDVYTANTNKSTYKPENNIKANQLIKIIEINIKGEYNKKKIKKIQFWIKNNRVFDIIILTETHCTREEFEALPKIHRNYEQIFIGHSTSEAQEQYIESRKKEINNNSNLSQENKLIEICKINKKMAEIKDGIIVLIKNNIKGQFKKRQVIQKIKGLSLK